MAELLDEHGLVDVLTPKIQAELDKLQPTGDYALKSALDSKVSEAPKDGSIYLRNNKAWVKASIPTMEKVIVNVYADNGASVVGQKITIFGNTYTYDGTPIEANIPFGAEYEVSADAKDGFQDVVAQKFIAGQEVRNVNVVYKVIRLGVFILDTDNNLFTSDEWDTANNPKAVGVAVLTDKAKFVIAPEGSNLKFGGYNKTVTNIKTTTDSSQAVTDLLGDHNTTEIIRLCAGYSSQSITGAPACEYCRNYTFKNGKKGYMGALGEWQEAYNNKAEVDVCMSKIGGTAIPTGDYHWASTLGSATTSWVLSWGDGGLYSFNKHKSRYVRPFCAFP